MHFCTCTAEELEPDMQIAPMICFQCLVDLEIERDRNMTYRSSGWRISGKSWPQCVVWEPRWGQPAKSLQPPQRKGGKSKSWAMRMASQAQVEWLSFSTTLRFPTMWMETILRHLLETSNPNTYFQKRYIIFFDLDLGPSVSPVASLSPRHEPLIDKTL